MSEHFKIKIDPQAKPVVITEDEKVVGVAFNPSDVQFIEIPRPSNADQKFLYWLLTGTHLE